MSAHFLRLRSSAPGLPGPYLVENRAAYQLLDALGDAEPSLVLAIGGKTKRRWLAQHMFPGLTSRGIEQTVAVGSPKENVLLFDCELHLLKDPPRFKPNSDPGKSQAHLLIPGPLSIDEIAFSLYSDVLSLFSHVIIVFVSDFDNFEHLLDFLCFWLRRATAKNFPTPSRIVLLHANDAIIANEVFNFQLLASFTSYLRQRDPSITSYSTRAAKQTISKYIEPVHLAVEDGPDRIWWELNDVKSINYKPPFSALHTKTMIQGAIRQFALEPTIPFDTIAASRFQHPVPKNLSGLLVTFLSTVQPTHSAFNVLTSALVMNAFPPGMHSMYCSANSLSAFSFLMIVDSSMSGFPPHLVFDKLYLQPLSNCENELQLHGLTDIIRDGFLSIVIENENANQASAQTHLKRIREFHGNDFLKCAVICAFCFVQYPAYTLNCKHRLCSSCIMAHGNLIHSWRFKMRRCPTCQEADGNIYPIQPFTACRRVLILAGSNVENIWQFFNDLQGFIGITGLKFHDLFDKIVGYDVGRWYY